MVGADPTRSSDTAAVKQSHPSISGTKIFRIQNGRMSSVRSAINPESEMPLPLGQCSVYRPFREMRTGSSLIVVRDGLRFRDSLRVIQR
jgi:hypothetical protein